MAPDTPLVMRRNVRTTCCDRVPLAIGAHRYVCRDCGGTFVDAAYMIVAAFDGQATITERSDRPHPSRSLGV